MCTHEGDDVSGCGKVQARDGGCCYGCIHARDDVSGYDSHYQDVASRYDGTQEPSGVSSHLDADAWDDVSGYGDTHALDAVHSQPTG